MDCPICLSPKTKLYNICTTCVATRICKECIKNLEKYEIVNCPTCRTKLNYSISYLLLDLIFHRVSIIIVLSLVLFFEYIVPVYYMYKFEIEYKAWILIKLTYSIFILKPSLLWLYTEYLRTDNVYIIPALYMLNFLSSFLIGTYNYSNNRKYYVTILNINTSFMYELPIGTLFFLILYEYISKKILKLSINNYKKHTIKYHSVEDAVYVSIGQSTGL